MWRLHWYAFSFSSPRQSGSCYIGYNRKGITMNRIAEAKKVADMPSDSVLVSCCYLGKMSRQRFKEGE